MTIHLWIFALAQLPLWETFNLGNFLQKIIPIQFLPPPDKYPPPNRLLHDIQELLGTFLKYPSSLSVCVSLDILTRPSPVSKQRKL